MLREMAGRSPTPDLLHEALLGEAAESAFFAITVYDDDGRLVAVNRRAAELLGYDREELLAFDVGAFTEGGFDRSRLFSQNMREGVRLVQRKDGARIPTAFVVAPASSRACRTSLPCGGSSPRTILALQPPPENCPGGFPESWHYFTTSCSRSVTASEKPGSVAA